MGRRQRIAITGGIGSGKSYVCGLLARRGIQVYDCDAEAKRLMRDSEELREELTRLIGPDTYQGTRLNKAAVARFLLASEENTQAINAIVHPAVAADFEKSGCQWLESAILYDSGFYRLVSFDYVIVVTAPQEIRIKRVMERDGIPYGKALEWVNRQWPQEEIRQRADFEIVNDGIMDIDKQLNQILESCKRQF